MYYNYLEEIDINESKQNKAFSKWLNSKEFVSLSPDTKQQLIEYVKGLHCEIADLQAMWFHKTNE